MRICTVPLLQIDLAILLRLIFFDPTFPWLVRLFRVGPIGVLPRIVRRALTGIFFVRFFFHASLTPSPQVRSWHDNACHLALEIAAACQHYVTNTCEAMEL